MIPQKNEVYLCLLAPDKSKSTDARVAWAAKEYLGEEIGPVARTERGKPYLPERPELHFSVSHSGKYFVCAFSGAPVGVDIQEHTLLRGETPESAVPRLKRTAKRFFHPLEADFVEEDTYERFFRVWTAKEACVKCTGQGIDNDFSSLCTVNESLPHLGVGKPVFWRIATAFFLQIKPEENYTLAVCTDNEFEIRLIK